MDVQDRPLIFVIGTIPPTAMDETDEGQELRVPGKGPFATDWLQTSSTADDTVTEHVRRGEALPGDALFAVLRPKIEAVDGRRPFGLPERVLFFDCPAKTAEGRVLGRNVGREGDNRENFERRYQEFTQLNPTIVAYYRDRGILAQLRWASKEDVEGDVNSRHIGRPIDVYGAGGGRGVELVIAEADRELCAIVPSREDRATAKKLWNATEFPQEQLLPSTFLTFISLADFEGLPGAAVQLTAFRCGRYAVSVKLIHCLSDALCLIHFVHSWAARSWMFFGDAAQSAFPTGADDLGLSFDPSLLDRYANLTAEGTAPDPEKISKARALPMHCFDWWATDARGYPSWATASSNATKPSAEELPHLQLSPSTFPPWPTSEMATPVVHVYLDITLGLRRRVDPPLPDSFVGPPILLAYIEKSGAESSTAGIGAIAGSIRQTMSKFTPDAVSAYLNDAEHEVNPQRLRQAFLGSRHTLVTSWVRARAYEAHFCAMRGLVQYIQGCMPRMDGLVQVMDVADTGDLDVSVCLEKEALHRFIQDPLLRAFEQ
ncbi:hypothetical protein DL767_005770 [Monosporascus sp. MG133]|nr:hypothetical protein DL767_005770 [Monosporascus sp. MG133]